MSSYADHTYYPFPPVLTAEDREYSKMVSSTTQAELARRPRPTAENPYPEERIAPPPPPALSSKRPTGASEPTDLSSERSRFANIHEELAYYRQLQAEYPDPGIELYLSELERRVGIKKQKFADPYDDLDTIGDDDSIYEFVHNWWPKNKIRVRSPEL